MWRAQAIVNRRGRNNVEADEMQPIAAQPRAVVAPTRLVTMEDFKRHKPSKFTGKSTLDEADASLRECEKICRVIECTDAQKLPFVTFLLVADVEYWWVGMQQLMQTWVEQAKAVEQLEMGPSRVARPQKNTIDSRQQKKSYNRPQSSARKLQCYNCGGKHLMRDCPKPSSSLGGGSSIGKCYLCDQMGHFARHYPNKKPVGGVPAKKPVGDRPRAQSRVFALMTTEATQSGATHSFVSNECVRRLGLVMRELGCELIVATPTSGKVSTTPICVGCPLEVAGHRFKAVKEIEAGATCFMILAQTKRKSIEEQISMIPMVDGYADVFPDEIPELPPSRDVDFTIN
ncbi:uncharacterized protein LOC114165410 [Vigna unguiculata]|uniref:uncharacterized protein LOC114165410 n=1 Tax=Vigna unguiculata TaxID=3917 RepID=UPI001016DC78|nr:uncharacterized protein LOC114165410 [Vigna unguiculata]